MSLRLLNGALRLFEKPQLARAKTPEALRKPFAFKARYFFRAPKHSQFRDDTLQANGRSVSAHWATAKGAGEDAVILYFHGGGYVFGSPRTHRAMLARLSQMTGMSACLPAYGLAPEHVFPTAVEDALTAYSALLERGIDPANIIMGGDSAGGGLVLALLGEICAKSLPQPAGVFAIAPLADMTFSGDSFTSNARADVVLPASRAHSMAEMYLQGADPTDPRASPLRADFTGAAPVFLTVGDAEILLDDTRRMALHLKSHGCLVTEEIAHNHPHVWHIFQGMIPEAAQGLRSIADWIKPLLKSSNGN